MTATALFYAGNPIVQLTRALRDQAAKRHLDIVDSARMFAAVHMSLADASIAVWWTKYHYALWRPVTAIQLADTDGNRRTEADPRWVPFVNTTGAHPRDTAVPGLRQRLQRRSWVPSARRWRTHLAPGTWT